MKRIMRINGVGEFTETCEYETNKIHILLDSLRSELKKSCEYGALWAHPISRFFYNLRVCAVLQ
jgi:hypothetical protein